MAVLIINGSLNGKNGNCNVLIQKVSSLIEQILKVRKPHIKVIHLADQKWTPAEKKKLVKSVNKASGLFFVTGTYWDSWGSPLQVFLENITELEGRPEVLGKPVVVCVLNHSVGGKGILSRLQGVLSTLGFLIPPMSGFVYSWVSQEALSKKGSAKLNDDLWSLNDLVPIIENFGESLKLKGRWKSWPVDRKGFRLIWMKDN